MTNQEKYEDLYAKILRWGFDRGIQQNGNARSQLIKTVEELSEGICAALRGDEDEIKDAIGDVMVTLIQAYGILTGRGKQLRLIDSLDMFHNWADSLSIDLSKEFGVVSSLVEHFEYLSEQSQIIANVGLISRNIQTIAYRYGYNFLECLELSYNTIKDRGGWLREDGVFVKEELK